MIKSHIDFIRNYGVVFKLQRFFHLSYRFFGLNEFGYYLSYTYIYKKIIIISIRTFKNKIAW